MGEIGERLFVSRNTVSSQVTSIYPRGIGVCSVGRDSATARDQRGEPDECQRLRGQVARLGLRSSRASSRKARVVDD